MAKIIAPNKQYTGVSASVSFVKGVGETEDPRLIAWFQERGYKVEDAEKTKPAPKSGKGSKKSEKDQEPPAETPPAEGQPESQEEPPAEGASEDPPEDEK